MALYKVYWTKQKTQKNKRWSDGFLSVNDQGKMSLMDESRSPLDSDFRQAPVCRARPASGTLPQEPMPPHSLSCWVPAD
jgi:hypothetical protein